MCREAASAPRLTQHTNPPPWTRKECEAAMLVSQVGSSPASSSSTGAPARPRRNLAAETENRLLLVAAALMCLLFCLDCSCRKPLKVPWKSTVVRPFRCSFTFLPLAPLQGSASQRQATRSERVIPHWVHLALQDANLTSWWLSWPAARRTHSPTASGDSLSVAQLTSQPLTFCLLRFACCSAQAILMQIRKALASPDSICWLTRSGSSALLCSLRPLKRHQPRHCQCSHPM